MKVPFSAIINPSGTFGDTADAAVLEAAQTIQQAQEEQP
jgi:hypothetical protein